MESKIYNEFSNITKGKTSVVISHRLGGTRFYDNILVILDELRDYTKKHFADEEAYMESIHYKKIFSQKIYKKAYI